MYLSDFYSVLWRKKKQREYSPENLDKAVQAVLDGQLSQNKAAHQYGGINAATIVLNGIQQIFSAN
jgi:transposase-like protein